MRATGFAWQKYITHHSQNTQSINCTAKAHLHSSFHHISTRKASNFGWELKREQEIRKSIQFIPDELQYSDKVGSSLEDIKEVLLSYNSHNATEKLKNMYSIFKQAL